MSLLKSVTVFVDGEILIKKIYKAMPVLGDMSVIEQLSLHG